MEQDVKFWFEEDGYIYGGEEGVPAKCEIHRDPAHELKITITLKANIVFMPKRMKIKPFYEYMHSYTISE